jgi:hypothetical protein
MTRGAAVEVFEPASTRATLSESESIRVTLRLAVYRQSVRHGAKPLEDHDRRFSATESLAVIVLM